MNWGGKTHGGTVMRWIDEAAYACGAGWCGGMCIAAYSGGVRFYRPIQIGHLVEVEARLLRTGRSACTSPSTSAPATRPPARCS